MVELTSQLWNPARHIAQVPPAAGANPLAFNLSFLRSTRHSPVQPVIASEARQSRWRRRYRPGNRSRVTSLFARTNHVRVRPPTQSLRAKRGNLVGVGDVVQATALPRRLVPRDGKLNTRETLAARSASEKAGVAKTFRLVIKENQPAPSIQSRLQTSQGLFDRESRPAMHPPQATSDNAAHRTALVCAAHPRPPGPRQHTDRCSPTASSVKRTGSVLSCHPGT